MYIFIYAETLFWVNIYLIISCSIAKKRENRKFNQSILLIVRASYEGCYFGGWILAPQRISETRPDYLLILPWNLKEEIMEQMSHIREWGGRFVVPIPEVEVFE